MNVEIEIDGNDLKWQDKCLQNAENHKPFMLINFTQTMVEFCMTIAKQHGYQLKGRIPATKAGVCRFIPKNYDTAKMTIPKDFIFSGGPED